MELQSIDEDDDEEEDKNSSNDSSSFNGAVSEYSSLSYDSYDLQEGTVAEETNRIAIEQANRHGVSRAVFSPPAFQHSA